jgi:serralysin
MATVNGSTGNDTLSGTAGDDTINGLGGNDTILGSTGSDVINGGDGFDSIEYKNATSGLVVDFAAGTINGGASGTMSFTNIERVVAGLGADRLSGNAAAQILTGQAGNDTLWGAGGVDTLWGANDADTFVFRETGTANADRINDFISGTDKILLDANVMSALGAGGQFAAGDGRFAANSTGTAQDAGDPVIFNTTTREVWYDADGSGAGARQLIATLQSGASLVATDIVVEGSGAPGGGGSGSNTIVGTEGHDSLTGTDGNDTINGLGGNDTLNGMAGSDRLDGGLGNDVFHVENQADVLIDAGGIDTVIARDIGSWTLAPGFENLVLDNGEERGPYVGIGNELNNHISASWGSSLEGRDGNDTLIGAHGDPFDADRTNYLFGGVGDDNLIGGAWVGDVLDGGAGDDTLYGHDHDSDTLIGGAGADTFLLTHLYEDDYSRPETISDFASGQDRIRLDAAGDPELGASGRLAPGDPRFYAAAGATGPHDSDDRFIFDTSSGTLYVYGGSYPAQVATLGSGSGAASLAATDIEVINGTTPPPPPPDEGEVINGTSGNDTLSGTPGNDTINGLGGNDLFLAGSTGGADVIDGGTGFDSIEFKERATSAITVDFNSGTITGGTAGGSINFSNIERILTGNFNDTLTGNAASQTLTGQNGNDTIAGGGAADTLWGGAGADAFVFREMGVANADRISDWASGLDKVQLDDAAFASIGALGNFAAGDGRFWSAPGATAGHDANDRVIYNQTTGSLYYDADGSGAGAAQLIATLLGNPAIAATDIAVI